MTYIKLEKITQYLTEPKDVITLYLKGKQKPEAWLIVYKTFDSVEYHLYYAESKDTDTVKIITIFGDINNLISGILRNLDDLNVKLYRIKLGKSKLFLRLALLWPQLYYAVIPRKVNDIKKFLEKKDDKITVIIKQDNYYNEIYVKCLEDTDSYYVDTKLSPDFLLCNHKNNNIDTVIRFINEFGCEILDIKKGFTKDRYILERKADTVLRKIIAKGKVTLQSVKFGKVTYKLNNNNDSAEVNKYTFLEYRKRKFIVYHTACFTIMSSLMYYISKL